MKVSFIDPGRLRTELRLMASVATADGMGGWAEEWVETGSLFAHVEPLRADSRFGAGQTLESVSHRITLRHRGDVASGMRFARDGRFFDIRTVHDPDETGRYLVCLAQEALS